ncbi:MAG: SGNH/GDSL hydrolase family protein, partial [Leptospira sp.]|nr:SGNH/GDSL hydrolase family protein [Leptospira sp.]
ADNLNKLIAEIQKRSSAKIILTAIPLTNDPILQQRIVKSNSYVRSLSSKYTVADIEPEFEKVKSTVRLYPINDNIHPEPAGYDIMGDVYFKKIAGL